MSYNWGPRYIIPSGVIKTYSGNVLLREELDEELLRKELDELGITGPIANITNPWYYRRENTDTWIKIGESDDKPGNFPARWNTSSLANGDYEVMGLMHVIAFKGNIKVAIARQNVVKVTVEN
jgi:hypothetical protein